MIVPSDAICTSPAAADWINFPTRLIDSVISESTTPRANVARSFDLTLDDVRLVSVADLDVVELLGRDRCDRRPPPSPPSDDEPGCEPDGHRPTGNHEQCQQIHEAMPSE